MLTVEPTLEMLAEWNRIFETHHSEMKPNRKSGAEVDQYFREKYVYQIFNDAAFQKVVTFNIAENEFYRNKLLKDVLPNIQSFVYERKNKRCCDIIEVVELSEKSKEIYRDKYR